MIFSQGCSGDERLMGKSLADIISRREKLVIAEGQEPDLFWVNLGGKTQYANSKRYKHGRGARTPGGNAHTDDDTLRALPCSLITSKM